MSRAWLLVLLVLFVCYLPHVLYGQWVYEDVAVMHGAHGGRFMRPRGLSYALLALETRSAGSAMLAHAVSVGLHVVAVGLVVLLAARLGISQAGQGVVLLVASLHPLTVETVAYAAQQGELLGAICVLGACVLATGRWWRVPVWLGLAGCLVGAALAKETAAIAILGLVPLTVVLCATRAGRPVWAAWWCPAIIAAALVCGGILAYGGLSAIVNSGEAPSARSEASDWLLVQSAAVARTLGVLVLPSGPFTVDYDYDLVPMSLRVLSVVVLAGVGVAAWGLRRRWTLGAYALAWMLIVSAPRLVVQTPRSYFNDHQAYLLVPAFALLVGAAHDRGASLEPTWRT